MVSRTLTGLPLIALCCGLTAAQAAPFKPTSERALNARIAQMQPGQKLVIANGTYRNYVVEVPDRIDGREGGRITIEAETPGKVRFTGASRFLIGGDHITARGFFFDGGKTDGAVVQFRDARNRKASHSRITEFAIAEVESNKKVGERGYPERGTPYVSVYGHANRVDHNSFYGKKSVETVLFFTGRFDEDEVDHRVDHNWFGFTVPTDVNGLECIRVSDSRDDIPFRRGIVINDNLFEDCDADGETISIKSSGVTVRNNTFLRSNGDLNVRKGNYNVIAANVLLGDGDPRAGGIRVSGKGNRIVRNYTDTKKPLRFPLGGGANRYLRVEDAVVKNNTFFNASSIEFRLAWAGGHQEPRNISFVDNLLLRDHWRDADVLKVSGEETIKESGSVRVYTFDGGWSGEGIEGAPGPVKAARGNGLYRAFGAKVDGKGSPRTLRVKTRQNTGASWYDKPTDFPD